MNKKAAKNNNPLNTAPWRYYLVLAVVALIYLSLMARTAYIQIIEPKLILELYWESS